MHPNLKVFPKCDVINLLLISIKKYNEMQSSYNVPVIPQNLRKEETITHIAESLNYLSQVVNDVINKINDRIELNSNNLSNLANRINTVNQKITSITGAKRAMQVFSSSRYPAANINRQYESVFNDKDCPELSHYSAKYKSLPFKDEPLETLQFYHVKVSDKRVIKYDGLGDVPKDVEAVNDLLLYSSGKNPYNKYVMSDTLQMQHTSKREDVIEGPEIGAAPLSISESTALSKTLGDSYFYTPNLGDVPAIDVPLDLPDLPGIADDLRYVDGSGPGIAPSVMTTPNIPDLPEIVTSNKQEDTVQDIEKPVQNTMDSPPEQVRLNDEKPPVDVTETLKEASPQIESTPKDSDEKTKKVINISGAHASLMEAIRKAGGSQKANLKSTEPKKGPSGGGDLMADLHAKLTLRRKGISGTKNPDGTEPAAGAMKKISAMIPPPPAKSEQSESATTDDDWDD